MTRGETLINLYEIGREPGLPHKEALDLAMQGLDKMYGELDVLWYLVYLEFRKQNFNQDASRDLAEVYLGKVQQLLDELS